MFWRPCLPFLEYEPSSSVRQPANKNIFAEILTILIELRYINQRKGTVLRNIETAVVC